MCTSTAEAVGAAGTILLQGDCFSHRSRPVVASVTVRLARRLWRIKVVVANIHVVVAYIHVVVANIQMNFETKMETGSM